MLTLILLWLERVVFFGLMAGGLWLAWREHIAWSRERNNGKWWFR